METKLEIILFTLLADGTLRSAIILDYEVDAKSYQLDIKVSDSKNASLQKLFTDNGRE